MTKEQFEEISRIFYPNDNYKLPFSSREETTREWIGRRIVEDKFPVSFSLAKYFELYEYLKTNNLLNNKQ